MTDGAATKPGLADVRNGLAALRLRSWVIGADGLEQARQDRQEMRGQLDSIQSAFRRRRAPFRPEIPGFACFERGTSS